jgi:hypothetical protein
MKIGFIALVRTGGGAALEGVAIDMAGLPFTAE